MTSRKSNASDVLAEPCRSAEDGHPHELSRDRTETLSKTVRGQQTVTGRVTIKRWRRGLSPVRVCRHAKVMKKKGDLRHLRGRRPARNVGWRTAS